MYRLKGDTVIPRYDNQISSFSVGRIEDVPVFHYRPGSLTLLTGTTSCNFDCSYCLNSHTLKSGEDSPFRYSLNPTELVTKAVDAGCQNIAFNINEPAVSLQYFLQVAERAGEKGLCVGCATNGYFTINSISRLADRIDFVNISLKSIRDDTYRSVCKVPGVGPVLRNIEFLHRNGIHVEVTTPIIPQMDQDEIKQIAEFVAGLDRRIPFHLFRLLPEYRMADETYTDVDELIAMRETALKYLDHVYIGNMVGSEWMDTYCSKCGTTLIKRVNTLGCGARLIDTSIKKGECPLCGQIAPIVGNADFQASATSICSLSNVSGFDRQTLGLLDAYGFRKPFDFKTGQTVTVDSPLIQNVGQIMTERPYPGDELPEADTWVTDVALELLNIHPTDLVMLDYAQAFFIAANRPGAYNPSLKNIFENIERFLTQTGFEPMVIGLGQMEPVEQELDLESVFASSDSFAQSSGKYAYFSAADMASSDPDRMDDLKKHCHVQTQAEFLASFENGYSQVFTESLDDFVAIANPGVVFKGLNSMGKKQHMTPALCPSIPVYTTLEQPDHIAEIAPIVERVVRSGKKVALIIVEGAGPSDFPWPTHSCRNGSGEYFYQLWQQYITISLGIPYEQCELQSPFRRGYWREESTDYPFSGKFHAPLDHPLGIRIGEKKSLAIGNRNILTHVCLEADIAVECYCCYMHNYGTLAVFRDRVLETASVRSAPTNGI
jgi:AmmeMemoRadiSam system radical SAM enzyme